MDTSEDRILEQIKQDPDVERSAHELLQLEDLKEHSGFQYLHARFSGFRQGAAAALARRLMSGTKVPPEEIAFSRGYAAAIEDFFKFPERLERELDRAAEKAWERAQEALSDQDDNTTPGG